MEARPIKLVGLGHRGRASIGFTLIELLVVVSIIALLVSILLPSLQKAREGSKRAVCASNMKNVMLASVMYADDNKDFFPGNEDYGTTPDWFGNSKTTWAKGLYPYLCNTWRVYACPSAKPWIEAAWGMNPPQLTEVRPGTSFKITGYCSLRRQTRIFQPASAVMYWEQNLTSMWCVMYPNGDPTATPPHTWDWPLLSPPQIHYDKPNYAFPDTHVEPFAPGDVWHATRFWPEYSEPARRRR